jgi:phosphoglycerate dehydrogenase-like enzyme
MASSGAGDRMVLLLNVDSHHRMWSLPDGATEEIARRFPQLDVIRAGDASQLRAGLPKADILYTWYLPREMFPLARRLKWIHTPAAGVDHLLHPPLRHSDVILTNSRGVAADAMADHVLTLMLALARRLPEAVRFQAQQQWGQDAMWSGDPPPFALAGRTLGILGLGGVGQAVANRALAFGMTVIATRHEGGKAPKGISRVVGPEGTPEILSEADFVVVATPLTPETRGLIGARELRRMKKTAYLVNVGRGEHIDEAALVRALREKWIAGAALDVFQREPLPKNSVLWRLPGLLISPHYAGTYPEHMSRATRLFLDNLALFLRGKKKHLKSVVDKKRGY